MTRHATGILYMVLSAVMLFIVSTLGKEGGEFLSLMLLIFLRFVVALLVFIPFLYRKKMLKHLFDKPNLKLQLLRCSLVLLGQYSLFYYLSYSTVLSATVLQNFSPLLIPVLDGLIFKHHIKPKLWVYAGISFV